MKFETGQRVFWYSDLVDYDYPYNRRLATIVDELLPPSGIEQHILIRFDDGVEHLVNSRHLTPLNETVIPRQDKE